MWEGGAFTHLLLPHGCSACTSHVCSGIFIDYMVSECMEDDPLHCTAEWSSLPGMDRVASAASFLFAYADYEYGES